MIINVGYFLDSGIPYVRIKAPAKVNLFLEVLGKREDGFHQVETLMCPISLFDYVLVEKTDDGHISLDLELPDSAGSRSGTRKDSDPAWDIPSGDDNLVIQAAKRLHTRSKTDANCAIKTKNTNTLTVLPFHGVSSVRTSSRSRIAGA